ncbi:hypothetical protein BG004_005481 [Podila humilis]|nr:hypothetical protein BG004_005481 [Podila humilis]
MLLVNKVPSPKARSRPPELLAQFVPPAASSTSYFDITPSSTSGPSSKKSSGYTTKTPGRRSKRTPAQSISSTITNGASASRRVSCTNTDTASQNSSSYLDEQDVEIDENSFYVHLQKMQERYLAQQEPGWLRSQHALLQAKHRSSGSSQSGQHYHSGDMRSSQGSSSSSRGLLPGSQLLSRMNSGTSSPSGSDYSSSPSFHPHLTPSRPSYKQNAISATSFHHQRLQPIQPYNCFQPGNVICVPRERSLGGLIFHKTFVGTQQLSSDTHILTPSPYYRGQYLSLDHKVVEIDKDSIKEISGFAHPRTVQILSEETVYNSSSQKPTRVLILDRPLEGDGVVFSRPFDGPIMPSTRKYSNDMAFLKSFPELNRALRDFHNLCQEFENTYVYIRGFATYTLDKLRLIYDKAYQDCLGDSVKLQKLLMRGIQAEQDCFSELMENVVLGKLYQKLFIHSLVPVYAQRDVEADTMIVRYHQYLFSAGGHRGLEGGTCLASSDGPLLQDTLRKLGLSEKLRTMRVDQALEQAAGLLKAWDQELPNENARFRVSAPCETEQEMRRRQLRESLRIIVQDERTTNVQRLSSVGNSGSGSPQRGNNEGDDDEDAMEAGPWNTPLEKVYCIKQVLDVIAAAAEHHLMHGQGVGFVQKKRSEVSVTTDDFIPLLALVIIQARMMRLGSNIFYLQRFRINSPKSDLNFALVTFEASVEFLKSDPLGIMEADSCVPTGSSSGTGSASGDAAPAVAVRKSIEFDLKSPTEEIPIMPWGTPSHTGWGFSPPKATSFTPAFDVMPPTPGSESETLLSPSIETSPTRPIPSSRFSDHQFQQRHARSVSMNFDDRFRKLGHGDDLGSGSSSNSSWSRSPMLGPRFSSGANSPLASPHQCSTPHYSEGNSTALGRRQSHTAQPPALSQRHSISSANNQAYSQSNHHLHRISVEQGRETMNRSTILPLQSVNMTPHLVVKPQIMLPPPTTPPMSGQNTSGRTRPMSMIVVGALASSAYSNSYTGPSMGNTRSRTYGSNNSSPATSPRLGPGSSSSRLPGARSNSLMSSPFPMMRANSLSSVLTSPLISDSADKNVEPSEPLSPLTPASPWLPKPQGKGPQLSSSPLILSESPVMGAVNTSSVPQSRSQTPELNQSRRSTHLSRIQTSPSSTTSSISTPTTPTTFSPSSSSNALIDSLATSANLASPSSYQGSELGRNKPVFTNGGESSTDSSAAGSIRSRSSTGRQGSVRLSFPNIEPSPSAPSTVFCKTTVTANAGVSLSSQVYEAQLPPRPTQMQLQPPRPTHETTRSAPEIPTLSILAQSGAQHTRARSPAISLVNTPFVLTELGKDRVSVTSSTNNSPVAEQTEELPTMPTTEKMPVETKRRSFIKSNLTNHPPTLASSSPAAVSLDTKLRIAKGSQSLSMLPASASSAVVPISSSNPDSLSSSLNISLPSLPIVSQQQSLSSQYISRQAAPEIIALSSPLTGSVVIRPSSPAGGKPGMVGSSYTASYEALRHGSNNSLSTNSGIGGGGGYSPSMRHSLDGPRPNSAAGYYGSMNGSTSSFGTSAGDYQQQQQQRQPSPMLKNSIPRSYHSSQHPLSGYPPSHHQRQHSASATPSVSMVSPSFTMGNNSFGRGLGIHTAHEGTGTASMRKKMNGQQQQPHQNRSNTRRSIGAPESSWTSLASSSMATTLTNTAVQSSSDSSVVGECQVGKDCGAKEPVPLSWTSSSFRVVTEGIHLSQPVRQRETAHAKVDSGKYMTSQQLSDHGDLLPQNPSQQPAVRSVLLEVEQGSKEDFSVGCNFPPSDSRRSSATSLRSTLVVSPSFQHYQDPQVRSQMMGEFLSELAKVEDGDVLIGNGRHGVLGRQ